MVHSHTNTDTHTHTQTHTDTHTHTHKHTHIHTHKYTHTHTHTHIPVQHDLRGLVICTVLAMTYSSIDKRSGYVSSVTGNRSK